MDFGFLSKKKIYLIIMSLVTVCTLFIYLFVGLINFPTQLHLLAGHESNISFSFPFNAYFNTECMEVSYNNDETVKENIEIDKDEKISINAEDEAPLDFELSLFGIPMKKVSVNIVPDVEVVPCGITVGVKIFTDGVMVLGTGSVSGADGNLYRPAENALKSGDLILSIDNEGIENKNDLIKKIKDSKDDEVELKVKRSDDITNVVIKPTRSIEDNEKKLGVWVRDSTQGIGTLTYYNPSSKAFGALGHGILDVDTKKLISVKNGTLLSSEIISIRKGKKGSPGELVGEINQNNVLGEIKANTNHGIYGMVNEKSSSLPKQSVKIGMQNDIHEGPAKIFSNISGSDIKEYDVYIESVNRYSSDDSKGMVIKITDKELLTKTNGIVQGMSGSPILQDGKLIGAVTHVFVQNPTKGYGIFIENMMKHEKTL